MADDLELLKLKAKAKLKFEQEQADQPGAAESFLRGAGQGATFGLQDELSAMLELGLGKTFSPEAYEEEGYKTLREGQREDVAKAREAHPYLTAAGDIVGSLPATIATAGMLGPAAQTVRGAGLLGAAEGALRGAGEAEDIVEKPLSALRDVATGGAIGGFGSAAGQKISNVISGKLAARAAAKKAAGKVGGEIAEKADEAVEAAAAKTVDIPEAPPKPTREDAFIASAKREAGAVDVTPEDVAHYKANKARVGKNIDQFSLDENSKTSLSSKLVDDLDTFHDHLRGMEKEAGDLIEKSDVAVTNQDLAGYFQAKIGELKRSGRFGTESGEAAIGRLKRYIPRLVKTGKKTGKPIVEEWDAKRLRQFIQGLWEDNRRLYVPGRDTTLEEQALGEVAGDMNKFLKENVEGLGDLMDNYSKDVDTWKFLRKDLKLDFDNAPKANNWVQSKFIARMERGNFGSAGAQSPDVVAYRRLGDVAGTPYQEIVKDNQVFGRLFPDRAKGLQKGRPTQAWTRAAQAILNPRQALGAIPGAIAEKAAKQMLGEPSLLGKTAEAAIKGTAAVSEVPAKVLPFARRAAGALVEGIQPAAGAMGAAGAGEAARRKEEKDQLTPKDLSQAPDVIDSQGIESGDPTLKRRAVSKYLEEQRRRKAQSQRGTTTESLTESTAGRYPEPSKMGRYSNVLRRAHAAGPESEGATHYILSQRDPDYRRQYEEATGG